MLLHIKKPEYFGLKVQFLEVDCRQLRLTHFFVVLFNTDQKKRTTNLKEMRIAQLSSQNERTLTNVFLSEHRFVYLQVCLKS